MARIEIPRAPLAGGALAQAPQPVDNGIGRAVANLGQQLHAGGVALETNRLSRDLGRARVDIANTLSSARLETQKLSDPDAIDTGWRDSLTQLRADTLGKVDPQNSEAAGLAFDELAGRHSLAVGQRAIQLREAQGLGLLVEHANALATSPGIGNREERATLLGQFADQVMDAVDAGIITPAQAQDRIQRQSQTMGEAAAIRMLSEDPDMLLASIDSGELPELAADTRERYRRGAVTEIDRRTAAGLRADEMAATRRIAEQGKQLSALTAIARTGRSMDGQTALLADPAMQSHPSHAEAVAAVELNQALPGFAAMTPDEQAALIETERAKTVTSAFETRALTAMEAINEATVRQQAALARAGATELNAQLADAAALASAGRQVADEDELLANPAAKDLPNYAALVEGVALRAQLPGFASQTPAEQAAQIQAEAARPIASRFENDRLVAMEAARAATVRGWRSDPIAQAAALDLGVAAALPADLSDPAAWATAFAARRDFGASLVARGYIAAPVFFTTAERDQLKAAVAPGQDARVRAGLASALAEGFGPDAPRALAGISDDPVFRNIGGLLSAGGRPDVALSAFSGQTAIEAGTVTLPATVMRQTLMFAATGALLAETFPDDAAAQVEILKTADAIYASRAQGLNPKDEPDNAGEIWTAALQTAMGAGVDAQGKPTGGVHEINGRQTWVPMGVAVTDFERVLDDAADLLLPPIQFSSTSRSAFGDAVVQPPVVDAWTAAAMSGGSPMFGGVPLSPQAARRASLIAIGDGVYRVEVKTGRTYQTVTDSADPTGATHFVISYDQLRGAVEQARRARR
jgi:hypothetical protein